MKIADAARQAAETRLRPILMTSFAFCLGVTRCLCVGAGSAARNSPAICRRHVVLGVLNFHHADPT